MEGGRARGRPGESYRSGAQGFLKNLSLSDIADLTGLSEEEIEALRS